MWHRWLWQRTCVWLNRFAKATSVVCCISRRAESTSAKSSSFLDKCSWLRSSNAARDGDAENKGAESSDITVCRSTAGMAVEDILQRSHPQGRTGGQQPAPRCNENYKLKERLRVPGGVGGWPLAADSPPAESLPVSESSLAAYRRGRIVLNCFRTQRRRGEEEGIGIACSQTPSCSWWPIGIASQTPSCSWREKKNPEIRAR